MEIKKRVLVIDDDRSVLDLLKTVLETRGYRVDTASNSREALEKIRETKYHLAYLDLILPDMNGILLSQEIGRIAPDLLDRTVFMTGIGLEPSTIEYFQSFVGGFLRKPLRLDDIMDAAARIS